MDFPHGLAGSRRPRRAVSSAVAALAGALALLPAAVAAQDVPGPVPSTPFSEAELDGIDFVFHDLDRTDTPGCAVGVVVDGRLAFADGYGSANLDHEIPITPQTVFYMGSVSKQFTAGAVALAAREGHLSLDDDVREWFPELPDYGDTIRVRHLVHHTSGIRDYLTLQGITGSYEGTTDEQIIDLLARQEGLNFAPGERELYSNSGYFLLSELVERATGMTLREYGEARWFGPLGMRNSHFHDDADHIVRYRATAYSPEGRGFQMNHAWGFAQVGSGGLYSNIVDMARWEAVFADDRMGAPGLRADLLERGVLSGGDTLDYAFGISHGSYRGVPTLSHSGSLAGFRTGVIRFPEQATSILVFCNESNAGPMDRARAVADRLLGAALAPASTEEEEAAPQAAGQTPDPQAPPTLSSEERAAFVGTYHSPELQGELEVAREDAGLVLVRRDGGLRELEPTAADAFAAGNYRLTFVRDGEGEVSGFVLDTGRANGIVFHRVVE